MYPYTALEAAGALRAAKNANAAIKKFLKVELADGGPHARFVKDLRVALAAKRPEALVEILEQGLAKFDLVILVLLRYAYAEQVGVISEQVVLKYADDFNATYERTETGIVVKDAAKFLEIFKAVVSLFEEQLIAQKLAPLGLMKNVLITFIFDPDVISEIKQRI